LNSSMLRGAMTAIALATLPFTLPGTASAQQGGAVEMDTARARALYVSNRPEDHPQRDHDQLLATKARNDSIIQARAAGRMNVRKITYRSTVGDLDIPAYVFEPLELRGPRGHAAMVWVHGGVHGDWTPNYLPFVLEAIERGYVIVAPEYRGSTGYGADFYNAIDYGGYEVDDAMSAWHYMRDNLPHVDTARVGMMGWSHGGYITILSITREGHPFKAGAAIVPVTNLFVRLAYKGPGYQRSFATQERLRGLPHERREEYVARSPFYQVDRLETPLLAHVATNDEDVNFEEASMLIYKLRALKPHLSETVIYENPAPWGGSVGHAFSRRVDPVTLERVDSPAQIDSWNRTWTFFDWHLRPYEDRSQPGQPLRTR
jgi:dipeptidyl aminopeptidase/acylaminoacyl peptidase